MRMEINAHGDNKFELKLYSKGQFVSRIMHNSLVCELIPLEYEHVVYKVITLC